MQVDGGVSPHRQYEVMTINPYQPVPAAESIEDSEALTSLPFDGVIEREDYAALLPNGQLLWWLQATLLLVLVPALVVGVFISSASLIKDGVRIQSLVILAMTCGLLTLAAFTAIAMGRRWRSHRYLTRFPDLLGLALGEFDQHGLLFHDGKRQHWFGPTVLAAATISKAGIRVLLPGSPYRYLALTKRLFQPYNIDKAIEFKAAWKKKAARRSHSEIHPIANLWKLTAEIPDGAVGFKGYCSTKGSTRSSEVRQRAIFEAVTAVGMFALACTTDRIHWFLGASVYSLFSAYACVQSWRQYFHGAVENGWYQYGWISATQIATCINEIGTVLDRKEVTSVNISEGIYSLTTTANNQLFIFREHVANEAQWQKLVDLLRPASEGHAVPGISMANAQPNQHLCQPQPVAIRFDGHLK